jgi:ferredoxin
MVRGVSKAQVEPVKTFACGMARCSKCTIKVGERPVFHNVIYDNG